MAAGARGVDAVVTHARRGARAGSSRMLADERRPSAVVAMSCSRWGR